MKVAVFDIPASDSGALSILKDFYEFVLHFGQDIEWYFIVGTADLSDKPVKSHVHVLRFPKAKRSWLYRIKFELADAHRIVKKIGADVVFSLQNLAVMRSKKPQIVYVHQTMPYAKKRFSYFDRDERFLAFYADIFRGLIGYSIRKARVAIVQTSWFRDALIQSHYISPDKVVVVPPTIRFKLPPSQDRREPGRFFYPATPYIYKNIDLIVEAVGRLRKEGLSPKVCLTINGNENGYSMRLRKRIEAAGLGQNFEFMGRITREEVLACYRSMTLLFPSRLESFGLPLLEARTIGGDIIAADTRFAQEILADYPGAVFHGEMDTAGLAAAMRNAMAKPVIERFYEGGKFESPAQWGRVVDLIRKYAQRDDTR